ncbi:hypothetical protein ASE74_12540 [Pedobacter sp. Leaf216]|nr:hypothetical protein ASE74_12540 [Pedobacter sp. Leaf216]
MSGLWFLAVCSPAIRYSPDEESGAAASVGFSLEIQIKSRVIILDIFYLKFAFVSFGLELNSAH